MSEAIKITPAMREWCRLINQPQRYTLVMSGSILCGRGSMSRGAPTWPMAKKLQEAGLITWSVPNPELDYVERAAIITEAGKAAAS